MTNDKGILIKNIYYMLCYAFQVLKQTNYENVDKENFDNIEDLFAEILAIAVAQQLKQGLYREYVTKNESLSVLRGKLDMPETIRDKMQRKQKLACEFDELSENNLMNQILRTTMDKLVRDKNVAPERKNKLKNRLGFFSGVAPLDPSAIKRMNWNRLEYRRNNRNYEMLMHMCEFVLSKQIQTTESGDYRMAAFAEDRMARLFEKFVYAYYERHYKKLLSVNSALTEWNLLEEPEKAARDILPGMKTDITLSRGGKTLIIDTKYYGKITQQKYEKGTLRNAHLYQIYAYVKNMDRNYSGDVAGLLLYAKTEKELLPDCKFNMGGNKVGAKTLDLNQDFSDIAAQLDDIAYDFFKIRREAAGM